MAMNQKRLSVNISAELDELIDQLADDANITRADVVRRALAIMKAYKQQKEVGRDHLGFTSDASKLEAELLNVL